LSHSTLRLLSSEIGASDGPSMRVEGRPLHQVDEAQNGARLEAAAAPWGYAMDKTRINLANSHELLEIPGIDQARRDVIVRHRSQSGPIKDPAELAEILGRGSVTADMLAHVDFAPADSTAPEAPGA
jgi:hypothetical protein